MKSFSQRPYGWTLLAIIVAWTIGTLVCWAVHQTGLLPIPTRLLWIGTIGSGVVAMTAGLPGALGELTHRGATSAEQITFGFSVGGLIRLFGTVALVALCRYHMPAATNEAAGLILGWYCYLTAIDVIVLAKLLPLRDRRDRCEGSGTDDVGLSSCPHQ